MARKPYIAPTEHGVVIRKGGYFYRPGWCGYTASIHEAGRYARADAEAHAADSAGVTVHEISEFAEAISTSWTGTGRAGNGSDM